MSREVLKEEQIKWAHEKHCEGYSVDAIAKALYVGRATIFRAFKKRGYKYQKKYLSIRKDDTPQYHIT